ncbi:MAG: hypothetical protein J6T64_00800 [Bacteroidaceae bacterium]|nr:hypothetical protein [Bacteroidaceae bacterium]
MKKFFRFFAMAAIAGSLMVACGDDDDDDADIANGAYEITMNGSNWTVAEFYAQWNEGGVLESGAEYDPYLAVEMCKTTAEDSPYITGSLAAAVISNGTYQSTSGDYMQYCDDNDLFEYQGQSYYNFVPDRNSFVENITAIDLNACKLSGNWTENYNDGEGYIATSSFPYTMTGKMNNSQWTAVEAK